MRWFFLLFVLPLAGLHAFTARLAVGDFQVQSPRPEYRFLGKGFSEFVSIELGRSANVQLIEREKRLEAIREIELSQTGLVEDRAQLEAGRLLTAQYLVLGNIYDIDGQLSITVRLLETETGRVLWQDRVSGRLGQYDALSARISGKILERLSINVPREIAEREKRAAERQEAVAINFATAVDAVDRKDTDAARRHLDEARRLDPESEAVEIYLRKLVVNTAKFRTISQEYFSNSNPASLGLLRADRLFMTSAIVNLQETPTVLQGLDRSVIEQDIRFNAGYQFPVGKRWGAGIEGIFFHYKDEIQTANQQPAAASGNAYLSTNPDSFGGIGSLSFAPNENISFGASLALYQQVKRQQWSGGITSTPSSAGGNYSTTEIMRGNQLGLSLGMIARNNSGTVMFDTLVGYSTQSTYLLNATAMTVGASVAAPIYNENTLTFGFLGKRLFLALKEINEFWRDRNYYSARILPVLELWLWSGLGLRGGAAHNYASLDGTNFNRTGWIVGLSLRSISTGWDFDINYTNHNRPSRIVSDQIINESIVYFTLSKADTFMRR